MILQELLDGTVYSNTDENGIVTFLRRPPTHKELRAAREIEKLSAAKSGMERSLQTLLSHMATLESQLNEARAALQRYGSNEGQQSSGALSGEGQERGSEQTLPEPHEGSGEEPPRTTETV